MCRGPTRRRTVRGFQQAGTCSLVITPRRFQQAGKLWRHHRDRCARANQGLHHAPPPAAAPHQPTTPLQREADAREIILANLLHLPRTRRSNAHVGMARCVARCVGYRSPRARRGGGSAARTRHARHTRACISRQAAPSRLPSSLALYGRLCRRRRRLLRSSSVAAKLRSASKPRMPSTSLRTQAQALPSWAAVGKGLGRLRQ